APAAFTASFLISSPWLLPLKPPSASMLPGTTTRFEKVRPPSSDTASPNPRGIYRSSRNNSQITWTPPIRIEGQRRECGGPAAIVGARVGSERPPPAICRGRSKLTPPSTDRLNHSDPPYSIHAA